MKPREYRENQDFNFEFEGQTYPPPGGRVDRTPDGVHCWSTTSEGMEILRSKHRLQVDGKTIRYVLFHDDYPVMRLTGSWNDTAPPSNMRYVVETAPLVVQRCMLTTTSPGDLVFDPTCGSGTTSVVAEQWGRRWISCDTSRVALTLARQRLMTNLYPYYQLAHSDEGVRSGFRYDDVPHLTLGSITKGQPPKTETLFDKPRIDTSKARVTGPFTVEAVPAPVVRSLTTIQEPREADASVARSGETLRQADWRSELLKTGIRGKSGQMILFSRVEPLPGTRFLHAEAETRPNTKGSDRVSEGAASGVQRVVVSFGPEHQLLEQRQVEEAWHEARDLHPRPSLLVFAAFQFDPEAAKDIDELAPEKAGMTLLKVQMNPDLLTDDLKKKRSSNQSFWLVGQPDVELRRVAKGGHKGQWQVEVSGFDYYNTKTGEIESGDVGKIAMWMLDTDYDCRSLFARQVFFPMAGDDEGWARLARSLRAEIDESAIEAYRGTQSLPFAEGKHKRVAVKIVDDRGIESLRIIEMS
jgi:adenine-specific DNA-methyltransferase